jgi:hypothetical protein
MIEPNRQDVGYKTTKVVAAALTTATTAALLSNPVLAAAAGAASFELFNSLFSTPLEKRRDRWLDRISRRLLELEEKIDNLRIEELADNEEFVSILIQASQVAIRTHQEDKIKALQNIVLNTALGIEIEDVIRQWCINIIDGFTPVHLKLMLLFDNSSSNPKEQGELSSDAADFRSPEELFPDFQENEQFYHLVCRDLETLGLINSLDNTRLSEQERRANLRIASKSLENQERRNMKNPANESSTSKHIDNMLRAATKGIGTQEPTNLFIALKKSRQQNIISPLGEKLMKIIHEPLPNNS